MRVDLMDDGATYQCSFEFLYEDSWRCPQEAHEAVDEETFEKIKDLRKMVFLHGRALCETHLTILDQ